MIPNVEVKDEIWLLERWFDRGGNWEYSQIVVNHKFLPDEATTDGWTVTHYKIARESACRSVRTANSQLPER